MVVAAATSAELRLEAVTKIRLHLATTCGQGLFLGSFG